MRFRRITEDNVPSTTHAFLFSPSASVAGTLPAGRYEITLSSLSLNTGNTNDSRSISGAFTLTLTLTLTDPSSGSPPPSPASPKMRTTSPFSLTPAPAQDLT